MFVPSYFHFYTNTLLMYQSNLHRLLFLACKALHPSQDTVIIVAHSLTKDITSNTPYFRANALRVLAQIVDVCLFLRLLRT